MQFDASNLPDDKAGLSSGIYFYKFQAGNYVEKREDDATPLIQ